MGSHTQRTTQPHFMAIGFSLGLGGCVGLEGDVFTEEGSNTSVTEVVRGPEGPSADLTSYVDVSGEDAWCQIEARGDCIRVRHHAQAEVCRRFVQDTLERSQVDVWEPGSTRCEPGRTATDARRQAVDRTNLYRWLMGLSPVVEDPARRDAVESCSLMQSLAGSLEHQPPQSWACWEAEGAAAAGRSNLSLGPPSPSKAVDGLMIDAGENNAQTLGHRRWISRPSLSAVAFGFSASGSPATCMHLDAQSGTKSTSSAAEALVMWPAPGLIPFEMVHPNNLKGEILRWSVVGETVGFGGANIVLVRESIPGTVSLNDEVLPSISGRLQDGVGDGMWLEPSEPLEAGVSYRVDVTGSSIGDVRWRTRFVDCGLVVPDRCDPVAQDCPLPGTACYGQDVPRCMDVVTPADPNTCRYMNECDPGNTCVVWADGESDCVPFCAMEPGSANSCETRCPQGVRELGESHPWSMCQRP